ncbi:hypothetical protein DTL42_18315 [Bremerella cremea]|uniref:LamG domain-containing protein n=1 Tax=Bremerella cremea TaxID=1031537 RepID=A0A368KR89_9BACT|nr:hypothetical protein [Bremerella cremea]RCS43941.1 hypothetical protein DTL42_18315 [Bremerella cremea]
MPITHPTEIIGLAHRYQPATGTFQDAAGTIVANLNDPIGCLPDSVGIDWATQSNTSKKPLLKKDSIGWHYAYFDGVDDYLQTIFENAVTSPFTIAIVVNILTTSPNRFLIDGVSGGRAILWVRDNDQIGLYVNGGPRSNVPFTPGQRFSEVAVFAGDASVNRIDDNEVSDGISPGESPLSGLTLAGRYQGENRLLPCDIYDVILYTRALSESERSDLSSYLTQLYKNPPPSSGVSPSFMHHHLQMIGAR